MCRECNDFVYMWKCEDMRLCEWVCVRLGKRVSKWKTNFPLMSPPAASPGLLLLLQGFFWMCNKNDENSPFVCCAFLFKYFLFQFYSFSFLCIYIFGIGTTTWRRMRRQKNKNILFKFKTSEFIKPFLPQKKFIIISSCSSSMAVSIVFLQ